MATDGSTHVLVFCASSESCRVEYHDWAARLGRVLAGAGMTIVYGGGALGSMGALAGAALEAGGRVQGIQPRFMNELGWAHDGLHALELVEDMQERMRRMLAIADAIVALPGDPERSRSCWTRSPPSVSASWSFPSSSSTSRASSIR